MIPRLLPPFACSAVAIAALLVRYPVAQQPAPKAAIDVSKLGPQVGQQVPAFSLRDQSGKVWTRESIAGPKGAVLVFIRSADW
jgi:uncharacterized lipoprotein YbaY